MANVHFYAPLSDGAFQDRIDDLVRGGAFCAQGSNSARCTWRGASFVIVHDPEPDGTVRAQLVDDGGLGAQAWSLVDGVLQSRSEVVSGGGAVNFFDPELMKYGNAVSPFSVMPSYAASVLAMERPLEDRYDPRYLSQPTAGDWLAASYENWQPEYVVGAASARMGSGDVRVMAGADEGSGFFDRVSEGSGLPKATLFAVGLIAGVTTLLVMRSPKHTLEFGALAAAGVAFAVYKGAPSLRL